MISESEKAYIRESINDPEKTVHVHFTKKNGEQRVMRCTTAGSLIPKFLLNPLIRTILN